VRDMYICDIVYVCLAFNEKRVTDIYLTPGEKTHRARAREEEREREKESEGPSIQTKHREKYTCD
jgi:hypothetical protein